MSMSGIGIIIARHVLPALEKEAAERKAQAKGKMRGQKSLRAETPQEKGRAAKQAADAAGVGETTVKQAKKVEAADPRSPTKSWPARNR